MLRFKPFQRADTTNILDNSFNDTAISLISESLVCCSQLAENGFSNTKPVNFIDKIVLEDSLFKCLHARILN